METMRAAELLRRLAGAVVLAVVTGLAIALLARLAEGPDPRVDYFTPYDYSTETTSHTATGHITDPRR